jgi:guanosine-3',5'-bis(diphosphate) 3'-pyrophosphohydrolase
MTTLSPTSPTSGGDPEEPATRAGAASLSLPPALMERLVTSLKKYLPVSEVELIEEVAAFAATATSSAAVLRDMLTVGAILADMHIVDATGITAGMLHHAAIDPATHTVDPALGERIATEFGVDALALIASIAHFSALESQRKSRQAQGGPRKRAANEQARHQQLEKIRKMFVGMGDDPRVVIFMLADHLMRVRAAGTLPADEALLLAEESRDIYAPLAARLGMARVEAELEDRAFAQLDPDEYRRVSNLVEQIRREQQAYIDRVCAILKDEAAKIGISADVSGRYKHLWSIYRKLERNGWDIQQVYDLIAFRIIVPTIPDCYAMLGQVHALWPPKEDRIKDFIAHKKPNGYQSLHTTVFCLDRRLAEIQIRTPEMHKNAEYGAAVHWYYKDVGDNAQLDKNLGPWITQIRDWQSDLQQLTAGQEELNSSAVASAQQTRIYVFTPHGDVKDLPLGSTPVDFAYQIHTNLGDHCAGARIISSGPQVTKRMVPLDYVLDSGEIIEIMTRRDAHPTRDWLKFVRTHAAKTHINRYLKQHERDIYITVGRERLDADLRKANLGTLEGLSEEILNAVVQQLDYAAAEDMFADIGGDTLRPSAVIQAIQARLKSNAPPAPEEEKALAPTSTPPTADAVLNLAGVGGLLARLANCCHPLPPDPIVGYISRGRGIVIHHTRCRSLHRLREREAERLVQVNWQQMRLDHYEASLVVLAHDRTGLMRDVTQQIQEMKINMQSVSSLTNRKGVATIALTLQLHISPTRKNDDGTVVADEVQVKQLLDEAIRRITAIRDVMLVQRDTKCLSDAPPVSLPGG